MGKVTGYGTVLYHRSNLCNAKRLKISGGCLEFQNTHIPISSNYYHIAQFIGGEKY